MQKQLKLTMILMKFHTVNCWICFGRTMTQLQEHLNRYVDWHLKTYLIHWCCSGRTGKVSAVHWTLPWQFQPFPVLISAYYSSSWRFKSNSSNAFWQFDTVWHHSHSNHLYLFTNQHGVTLQKTWLFISVVVRTQTTSLLCYPHRRMWPWPLHCSGGDIEQLSKPPKSVVQACHYQVLAGRWPNEPSGMCCCWM